MDQAGLALERATKTSKLMQIVWIYDHPVDFEGLIRFHRNLGYGSVGRRIQRSALPFGRYRWVASLGPQCGIDIAEHARPRAEVTDWADDRAALPVDAEQGPGWHLGVLPLTDGSTAITLVGSHLLVDGVGAVISIIEAALGSRREIGYPSPLSRKRFRTAMLDLGDIARSLPSVTRTAIAAAKLGWHRRGEMARASNPKHPMVHGDELITLPAISVFVDLADWDARARVLNGNSYSLLAGYAARLGAAMGRRRADGTVSLVIALNDRTGLDDTRAQAMVFAAVGVNPTQVTNDLTEARIDIRHAVRAAREVPDETLQLLPLVPFVPGRTLRRVAELFFGAGDDLTVSCSNLGELDAAVGRPDGSDAEYVIARGVDRGVRRADIERTGGQLVLVAARIRDKMSITIVGYQCGAENSKARLRTVAMQALAQFDLTGAVL